MSAVDDPWDDLLERWLDGDLSESESARLAQAVRSDAEDGVAVRARLRRLGNLRAALVPVDNQRAAAEFLARLDYEGQRGDFAQRQRERMAQASQHLRIVRQRRRATAIGVGTIAAAVTLVVMLLLLQSDPSIPSATLVVETGSATLDGRVVVGRTAVGPGALVVCADETQARLVLPDTSQLDLDGGTSVSWSDERGLLIRCAAGRLVADLRPQPPGRPLGIRGAWGEATAIGTAFTFSESAGVTAIAMERGRVRFLALASDRAVELGAGEEAAANAAGLVTAAPFVTALEATPSALAVRVIGFELVASDDPTWHETLADGATIDLARYPGRRLNLRVLTDPPSFIGHLYFTGSGIPPRTEATAPYLLYGNSDTGAGEQNRRGLKRGRYRITATPYGDTDVDGKLVGGTGPAGSGATIAFTIVDSQR